MAATLIINLSQPIERPGQKPIRAIELRAPAATDFYELPEPIEITKLPDGTRVVFDQAGVTAWIERLSGISREVFGRLSMSDGRRLISAIDRLYMACRPTH